MVKLNKPRQAGPYRDRDIACQEAIEQDFLELAKGLKPDDIVAAAGGNLAPVLTALAQRAESVGWTLEEAEVAIGELAQNLLDDMAEM
jgi:predicted ThiF/HesA family dinucleotide-utilizing enzyme